MSIKSYAKINLHLQIVGTSKKLHLLDGVYATIDCHDDISITSNTTGDISVRFLPCNDNNMNCNINAINTTNNSIYQVIKWLLLNHKATDSPPLGFAVDITKKIPIMAGLGGSSSNAATVAKIIGEHYLNKKINSVELIDFGSDVPYMYNGGFARVHNVGDSIERFDCDNYDIIIIKSGMVSTKECFKRYDTINPNTKSHTNANLAIKALQERDFDNINKYCVNQLTQAATELNPKIPIMLQILKDSGAIFASMTGSGAACYGLYENSTHMTQAYNTIKQILIEDNHKIDFFYCGKTITVI